MTTWLLIFGLSLIAIIVLDGIRQREAEQSAPLLASTKHVARGHAPLHDMSITPSSQGSLEATGGKVAPLHPLPLTVDETEAALALQALQHTSPWLLQAHFKHSQWASVMVTLIDHHARYDEVLGGYHILGNDGLLRFSVLAPASIGRLPSPYDHRSHQSPIAGVLLALPQGQGTIDAEGFRMMLTMANDLALTNDVAFVDSRGENVNLDALKEVANVG